MKRLAIFIDGSNLHGGLGRMTDLHRSLSKLKATQHYFIDFKKLRDSFHKPTDEELVKVYYARSETDAELNTRKDFYRTLNTLGYKLDIKERKNQAKEKGVDMAIAMEMLILAFYNVYDEAILVAGDADYCQLVREVQRFGKRVGIAAFAEDPGLSNKLLNESDFFTNLTIQDILIIK